METRIPARLTPREGRKFGLTVGAAFLVLAGVLLWRDRETAANVLGAVGGALVLAGLLVPGHLGPVYRGWMRFGLALSKVTTPIFMGLVYFGVIVPTGLMRRALGRNSVLGRRGASSYWVSRSGSRIGRSNLQRQF